MGEINKKLECDLVMRGGITSGIVYPRAIAKLAETYNFRSIGGTSAGAIAAAATAAAQLGANTLPDPDLVGPPNDPLQVRIRRLPIELSADVAGQTRLESLFQPEPDLKRLFALLRRRCVLRKVGGRCRACSGLYAGFTGIGLCLARHSFSSPFSSSFGSQPSTGQLPLFWPFLPLSSRSSRRRLVPPGVPSTTFAGRFRKMAMAFARDTRLIAPRTATRPSR